jgi:sirohydrochlorin cobaltochelatase
MHDRVDQSGLLLVGHGTRSAAGKRQFLELAAHVARRLAPAPVQPAFLELQEPDIRQAIALLAGRGATRLVVAPLLLFSADHARHDIPSAAHAALARAEHRGLSAVQADVLGLHPAMVELSSLREAEALAGRPPLAPDATCLLLVGRGTSDAAAVAEMHAFASQRRAGHAGQVEVAFVAVARPSLGEQLANLATQGPRRVVVQPHLLFEGEVADSIQREVEDFSQRHPNQEWIVTSVLADPPSRLGRGTELLGEVICQRWHGGLER